MNTQTQGSVHLWLQYSPAAGGGDAGAAADSGGRYLLHDVYFPAQDNNRVTLYQDADTPALDIFRGVRLADGSAYRPPRCWMDLFQAISQVEFTC